MIEAITNYLPEQDRSDLIAMMGDKFVLKVPTA